MTLTEFEADQARQSELELIHRLLSPEEPVVTPRFRRTPTEEVTVWRTRQIGWRTVVEAVRVIRTKRPA